MQLGDPASAKAAVVASSSNSADGPDPEFVAKVAARAIELAKPFCEKSSEEMARLARGDSAVLYAAAQRMRRQALRTRRPVAAGPEHVAFSILAAASELLRSEASAAEGGGG